MKYTVLHFKFLAYMRKITITSSKFNMLLTITGSIGILLVTFIMLAHFHRKLIYYVHFFNAMPQLIALNWYSDVLEICVICNLQKWGNNLSARFVEICQFSRYIYYLCIAPKIPMICMHFNFMLMPGACFLLTPLSHSHLQSYLE
jgi:uncharacterized membrane protein